MCRSSTLRSATNSVARGPARTCSRAIVLRTAVKWGHLTDNPAHNVDSPVLKTVRPKWVLAEAQAAH